MSKANLSVGEQMHKWAQDLFPICRSITGEGVRTTLNYLQSIIPELTVNSIPSGTDVFDWTIPKEWNITDGYIIAPNGEKIIDFNQSNLHVMGYSMPIDKTMSLEELKSHLYDYPQLPEAIPYVTSYYSERWGFCLSTQQKNSLTDGHYQVKINSSLTDGVLNYGEILIKGRSEQEIFISTYICHPSLANNELSGPIVTTALVNWIKANTNGYYSYRIVFVPETIGAIAYLALNKDKMKENVVAGLVLTCIGDDRDYSYLSSRAENTLADKAAVHVLKYHVNSFKQYSFLQRGSDERQYCAPGVDLPVCSLMRTKYGEYPEYHTSFDDLTLVTPQGLQGGYDIVTKWLQVIENNNYYKVTVFCEPQLGKRGLYPTVSSVNSDYDEALLLTHLIAYCDGQHSLLDIAEKINISAVVLHDYANKLVNESLLAVSREKF